MGRFVTPRVSITAESKAKKSHCRIPLPDVSNLPISGSETSCLQRTPGCTCDGGCPRCEKSDLDQLHSKDFTGTALPNHSSFEQYQQPPDLTNRVRSLRGCGQPLSKEVRNYFEPRFGENFGDIRVHAGSPANRLTRRLRARAFTCGRDVVFARGEFRPNSRTGRHLLAHELVHTIQQTRTNQNTTGQIQRKMGFEFQTARQIVKSGTKRKLSRVTTKSKKIIPRGLQLSGNLNIEVDEAGGNSVIEFVTSASNYWTDLEQDITDAVTVANTIKNLPVKYNSKLNKDVWSEFRTNYGKLDVVKNGFAATVQATEGITLDEIPSYIKEHKIQRPAAWEGFRDKLFASWSIDEAKKLLKPHTSTGVSYPRLRGLLTLILHYLYVLHWKTHSWLERFESKLPKNYFRLMTRVDFVTLLGSLSKTEQELFKRIVESGAIERETRTKSDDPLIPSGYWVRYSTLFRKPRGFTHFLIVPLKNRSKIKAVWHRSKKFIKCDRSAFDQTFASRSEKVRRYMYRRNCVRAVRKVNKRFQAVTVRAWLNSMYKKTYKRTVKRKKERSHRLRPVDMLSPLPGWGGGQKAGYGIGTWPMFGNLVAFENRIHKSVELNKWKEWAKKEFENAQKRRGRLRMAAPKCVKRGSAWMCRPD